MKHLSLLPILLILLLQLNAGVYELPLLKTAPPQIDGKLNESCYRQFPSHLLQPMNAAGTANPATRFAAFTDGKKIYLAFEVATPQKPDQAKAGASLNFDYETIELFVAPKTSESLYYHFAFDPFGRTVSNQGLANAGDYSFPWPVAISQQKNGYTAEIEIPVSSLDLPELREGDRLAINIGRVSAAGPDKYQSLEPLGGSFHQRDRFPEFIVGSYRAGAERALQELPDDPARKQAVDALRQQAARITNAATYQQFCDKLSAVSRELISSQYRSNAFQFWQVNAYQPPRADFLPQVGDFKQEFRLTALRNEVVTLAVGIANAGSKAIRFRAVATAPVLKGEKTSKLFPEDCITVRRLVETKMRTGATQRDALPEVDIHDVLDSRPGENEVLYLSVDASKLTPGEWEFKLRLLPTVDPEWAGEIPVRVTVKQTAMSTENVPYSLNFAYYGLYAVSGVGQSEAYRKEVFRQQKAYGTNVHIVNSRHGFNRKADANGELTGTPDYSGFDPFIEAFGTQHQMFLITAKWLQYDLGLSKSAEVAERNFAKSMSDFQEFLRRRGIPESAIAWYILDEPLDPVETAKFLPVYQWIKKYAPEQHIFCTFYIKSQLKTLELLNPYVDLWMPTFGASGEQIATIKQGREPQLRMFYSVSNRTSAPYNIYRLMLWRALQRGAVGAGYWSYDDIGIGPGKSTWDDTDSDRSDFAVIYEGSRGPQSSVRQEAWFRGLQDWRILELADPKLKAEALQKVLATTHDPALAEQWIERVKEHLK